MYAMQSKLLCQDAECLRRLVSSPRTMPEIQTYSVSQYALLLEHYMQENMAMPSHNLECC